MIVYMEWKTQLKVMQIVTTETDFKTVIKNLYSTLKSVR